MLGVETMVMGTAFDIGELPEIMLTLLIAHCSLPSDTSMLKPRKFLGSYDEKA